MGVLLPGAEVMRVSLFCPWYVDVVAGAAVCLMHWKKIACHRCGSAPRSSFGGIPLCGVSVIRHSKLCSFCRPYCLADVAAPGGFLSSLSSWPAEPAVTCRVWERLSVTNAQKNFVLFCSALLFCSVVLLCCSALLCSVLFCSVVLLCSALLCSVLFCSVVLFCFCSALLCVVLLCCSVMCL